MNVRYPVLWGCASLVGVAAVALLAIGSHVVAEPAIAARVHLVGVLLLVHAPLLLLLACSAFLRPALGILAGVLLFSTGVLGRAMLGIEWPLPVAPIGGSVLMLSWLWLGACGWRAPR